MTRRETAQQAISKAVELRPVVIQVDNDFWAVQGSKPGHGYLVERDPATGDLWCPCKAAEMTGTCYHRASVGLAIGTVPQAWIPMDANSMAVAS
jgi:hypothetical protein